MLSKPKSDVVDLCLSESDSEAAVPGYGASQSAGPSGTGRRGSSPLHFSSREPSLDKAAKKAPLDLGTSILRTAPAPVVDDHPPSDLDLPLSPGSLRAKRLAYLAERTSSAMPSAIPAKQTALAMPHTSAAIEVVDLT